MTSWQNFEKHVFKYLRRRYSEDGQIDFTEAGGANSNELDIRVLGKNGGELLVEVKMNESQAGQFMVKLENGTFAFQASRQSLRATPYQIELIKEINKLGMTSVDQTGFEINCHQSLISNLVKEHYQKKGASFFISGDEKNLCIIPLTFLSEAFHFRIKVRRKKSGSRAIPKSKRNAALEKAIEEKLSELKLKKIETNLKEKDVLIQYKGETTIQDKHRYFNHSNETLYLSGGDGSFKLKLTSRTNNITVAYEAKYKDICDPSWENIFKEKLKDL